MATYLELYGLRAEGGLKAQVSTAITIVAQGYFDLAGPTANQLAWAKTALADPETMALQYLKYLLAKNNTLTVAQFGAVADSAVQTAVAALVAKLVA